MFLLFSSVVVLSDEVVFILVIGDRGGQDEPDCRTSVQETSFDIFQVAYVVCHVVCFLRESGDKAIHRIAQRNKLKDIRFDVHSKLEQQRNNKMTYSGFKKFKDSNKKDVSHQRKIQNLDCPIGC